MNIVSLSASNTIYYLLIAYCKEKRDVALEDNSFNTINCIAFLSNSENANGNA